MHIIHPYGSKFNDLFKSCTMTSQMSSTFFGSYLASFHQALSDIVTNKWVLDIITDLCTIQFLSLLFPRFSPCLFRDYSHESLLQTEVASLLHRYHRTICLKNTGSIAFPQIPLFPQDNTQIRWGRATVIMIASCWLRQFWLSDLFNQLPICLDIVSQN